MNPALTRRRRSARGRTVRAAAWALSIGIVGASSVAWPCSGLDCSSGIRAVPWPGATIPANAPAIGVQRIFFGDSTWDGGTWPLPATSERPTLRGDGGLVTTNEFPSQVGVFIVPPAWTVGSSWELALRDTGSPCDTSTRFTIGPPAPVPTVAAMISQLESRWSPAQVNTCGGFPEAQLVSFRMQPTAEMEPWLALARWELEVDGRSVTTSSFGVFQAGVFEPALDPQSRAFPRFYILQVECNPGPSGIGPGLHTVRFLARIEGIATPIASNALNVQVACTPPDGGRPDEGLPDGGFAPDAGLRDAGSEPDAGTPLDGGRATDAGTVVLDGGASMVSGPVPPGGCSSSPIALSSLMGLALWGLRRRASRP
jgi:hypothetical protein